MKKQRTYPLEDLIIKVITQSYEDDPISYVSIDRLVAGCGYYLYIDNRRLRKGAQLDLKSMKDALNRADRKLRQRKEAPEAIAYQYRSDTSEEHIGARLARTTAEKESILRKLDYRNKMIEGLQKGTNLTVEIVVEKNVLGIGNVTKYLK